MTNPTPHGQVPAIQRYSIGYHSDEWGVRSLSPTGIYDDAGPWVRYEDHLAALVDAQQAAPSAASKAVLAAIRAANMQLVRTGDDTFVLVPYLQAHVQNQTEIEHVAGDVSKNGAEVNVSTQQQECGNTPQANSQPAHQRDTGYPPLPECDATTVGLGAVWNRHSMRAYVDADRAARDPADSVLEDAARYRWLARKVSAHGICDGWQFGFPTALTLPANALAMTDPETALGQCIDAARKQGGA